MLYVLHRLVVVVLAVAWEVVGQRRALLFRLPRCGGRDHARPVGGVDRRYDMSFLECRLGFGGGDGHRLCAIHLELFSFRPAFRGDLFGRHHALFSHLSRVDLSRQPAGLAPGEVAFSKETSLPEHRRVFHVEHPYRARGNVQDASTVWVEDVRDGEAEEVVKRFSEKGFLGVGGLIEDDGKWVNVDAVVLCAPGGEFLR